MIATRLTSVPHVFAAVLVFTAMGCGPGTATGDVDKVRIEISAVDVTVTNTAGRALLDARLEIVRGAGANRYSVHVGRLENGERRSFVFSRFTDRDAVPYSPRTAKASTVAFQAKDVDDTVVQLEVPWK